jgi:hypothetical protein
LALRPSSPDDQQAKRKASQQDVFLREVDDALRQDEMLGAFKNYGRQIGLVVALGLAIFAGVLWWNHYQASQAGQHGEQMTQALDDVDQGKLVPSDKQLAVLAQGSAPGPKGTTDARRNCTAAGQAG